ncbi:disks large-associated protein [Willisornis vidua]|uniref:Disks large-associated protein n=1 Tax=Willisornis vidua TaxID=1566151 RepID=A0ABQ9DC99_9PASS|nr:disks large-associated protein [Willisornis vidua]
MKGLSSSRSHHHGVACDPSCDSLPHHQDRKPYLLNPVDPHPADHPYYTQRNSFQAECMVPYNDQIASSTFPRRHYSSHHELKDECALVPHGTANKTNRIPANLLDQFERQLPLNRDGYHTLQYKRTAMEHRSDSPGRIRHLVHSVQKLFTKSHSLEGPSKGSINGGKASPEESQTMRYGKRSKSKERRSEGKPRSNASGWWSSDDNLDNDVCIYHGPSGVMTMGRCPDRSSSQYFMEAYNTISEHTVKSSRSNNDVKCSTCANLPVNLDSQLMKKSSWSSTLTVSRAREVYQKASVNMDQTVVKAETCQQERSCQYLQVPQDEWTGYTPRGKDDEIPCRRMRSGSYIKAMGDDDSGDSDTSPKPSPKIAARRESYLKATQPSLTELTTLKISSEHSPKLQIRSHSYLRAVSEVSINRSLDSLDPAGLLTSPKFRSRNESYMRAMSTISQVSEMEVNGQFESVCESVFSELESQAVEALDLPMPGCFRMRSHSYVRAIEKGCSQDDECISLRSSSPPRTTTTVRTIQSSTGRCGPFMMLRIGWSSDLITLRSPQLIGYECLVVILQQSWLTKDVPVDWRLANVTPVYKKSKKEDPGNHRPVSRTSMLGKVMEQIILNTIMQHVQNNQHVQNLPSHHGFQKGRSCSANLLSFYDKVTRTMGETKAVAAVYLDCGKAYDIISHCILLKKLSSHGTLGWLHFLLGKKMTGWPGLETDGVWYYIQLDSGH